jgi:hypothetical protein
MTGPRMLAAVVLVSIAGYGCGSKSPSTAASPTPSAAPAPTPVTPQCDPSLWSHVYDPTRLHVSSACETVTGVIVSEHSSDDGDIDMPLMLDPPFANLLNKGNIANLGGNLNVEAICQAPFHPDIPAAPVACGSFKGSTFIPPVGAHVQVTGSYVLDTNHGWMEIHPASVITVLH